MSPGEDFNKRVSLPISPNGFFKTLPWQIFHKIYTFVLNISVLKEPFEIDWVLYKNFFFNILPVIFSTPHSNHITPFCYWPCLFLAKLMLNARCLSDICGRDTLYTFRRFIQIRIYPECETSRFPKLPFWRRRPAFFVGSNVLKCVCITLYTHTSGSCWYSTTCKEFSNMGPPVFNIDMTCM